MSVRIQPEEILKNTGGCGLHQIVLCTIVQAMKTVVCWDMEVAIFSVKAPEWWCVDDLQGSNHTVQQFENINNVSLSQACTTLNGSRCSTFLYEDGLETLINEWDLVCDRSWIPATLISAQMAGLLAGHLVIGHLADLIGRKKPLFFSLFFLLVCNIAAALSVSWPMLMAIRVCTGLGMGGYLTLIYNIMGEYTLSKWRPLIVAMPTWNVQTLLFTLTAWRIPNWQYLHYIIAGMTAAFLPTYFFIPESFRWLLAHGKTSSAYHVIKSVAKINRVDIPETFAVQLKTIDNVDIDLKKRKYSILDLVKSRHIRKTTALLLSCWFGLGFIGYGMRVGLNDWSGSVFFNMFLVSVTTLPVAFLSIYLMNKLGRRTTAMLAYGTVCLTAAIVGIINYVSMEPELRNNLKKGFALVAILGSSLCWGLIQTITTELYPTVVRSTGYGFLNIIARVGAIVGPQLVYFDTLLPGILYFLSSGVAFLSIVSLILLPETRNKPLQDTLVD